MTSSEEIISSRLYDTYVQGWSLFSDCPVLIIGEQVIRDGDKIKEMYIYNIIGYAPKNGQPFSALKANIYSPFLHNLHI